MRTIAMILLALQLFAGSTRAIWASPLGVEYGKSFEVDSGGASEGKDTGAARDLTNEEEHQPNAAQTSAPQGTSAPTHRHRWVKYVVIVGAIFGMAVALAAAAK